MRASSDSVDCGESVLGASSFLELTVGDGESHEFLLESVCSVPLRFLSSGCSLKYFDLYWLTWLAVLDPINAAIFLLDLEPKQWCAVSPCCSLIGRTKDE